MSSPPGKCVAPCSSLVCASLPAFSKNEDLFCRQSEMPNRQVTIILFRHHPPLPPPPKCPLCATIQSVSSLNLCRSDILAGGQVSGRGKMATRRACPPSVCLSAGPRGSFLNALNDSRLPWPPRRCNDTRGRRPPPSVSRPSSPRQYCPLPPKPRLQGTDPWGRGSHRPRRRSFARHATARARHLPGFPTGCISTRRNKDSLLHAVSILVAASILSHTGLGVGSETSGGSMRELVKESGNTLPVPPGRRIPLPLIGSVPPGSGQSPGTEPNLVPPYLVRLSGRGFFLFTAASDTDVSRGSTGPFPGS
ncbi:hypothetical protein LX36DRAFT_387877 [Colletotrichum falcatum]|nr:hypothetical protein LX36DRAFT_387877 [Colletotrichum falcatum]